MLWFVSLGSHGEAYQFIRTQEETSRGTALIQYRIEEGYEYFVERIHFNEMDHQIDVFLKRTNAFHHDVTKVCFSSI